MAQEKVYVDPNFRRSKNQDRIKKEEEELEALIKGTPKEEPQEEKEELQEEKEETQEEPLSSEEKTFKKRYGDLRRHMSEKEKEWEAKFEQLKNQQNKNFIPPKSDEDIEAWARQYPDVAGIVETIAHKKAKELFAKAEDRLKEFDEAKYEATRTKAETRIRKVHEDFDDLRASDEFHNWADEQPKWVRDALYENEDDPDSVIRVIDLYKVDKGMTVSARKAQTKDVAKNVRTSGAPQVDPSEGSKKIRESDVAKMSDKQFEEKWDEIQKAQRDGNFIYDLSGGAR